MPNTLDELERRGDALAEAVRVYINSGLYHDGVEPPDALEREWAALGQVRLMLSRWRQARGIKGRGFSCCPRDMGVRDAP